MVAWYTATVSSGSLFLFYLGKTHLKLPFPREDRCSNKPNRPLRCSSRVFRAAGKCGDPARERREKEGRVYNVHDIRTYAFVVCHWPLFTRSKWITLYLPLSPRQRNFLASFSRERELTTRVVKDTSELYLFS